MRTKQSSSSLRKMSDSDLRFLLTNEPGMTFGTMRSELKRLYKIIDKKAERKPLTDTEKNFIKTFRYGWAGYDDFFNYYKDKRYTSCLMVLDRDIKELTRRTNDARLKWTITSGVKTELKRRGLL